MQTKKQSLFEILTNQVIGIIGGWLIVYLLFPLFDHLPQEQIATISAVIFFIWSSLRSYILRRLFNKKIKKIDYDEVAFTCIRLLENTAGAEFEDEHMAMDIIAETIEKAK
jgi:hypothetical protein